MTLTSLALIAVATQAAVTAAPADRYFGKLKMSALRVRYETMQLKKRYETHQLRADETIHLLVLTEDAFDEWSRLYPKDPWLASTGFAMAHLYEELPSRLSRDRAVKLFAYVKTSFPNTRYAPRAVANCTREFRRSQCRALHQRRRQRRRQERCLRSRQPRCRRQPSGMRE